jgi:segregation and condensation protein A
MSIYQHLVENSGFDSARQSQIEASRSERGSPSRRGKGDEEDQFGKAAASQNKNFQLGAGINVETFALENFEGPLDLLWYLITRQEIDIYQIPIIEITHQYLSKHKQSTENLDHGAEFIALAASFIWFKSKALLPKHEQQQEQNLEEDPDPHFDIIHHLVDYCRFKQAAKDLASLEEQQGVYYARGVEEQDVRKNLGIHHLSLDDLATLFQQILSKSVPQKGIIKEEEWKVSDKIHYLREWLARQKKIDFTMAFNPIMGRMELIVTFLALLEMMKSGEAKVVHIPEHKKYYILTGG